MNSTFNVKQNELSIILHKYRKIFDYNKIPYDTLRYSIKAHLRGRIHIEKIYIDNMPMHFRFHPDKSILKKIAGQKYEWDLRAQETFIQKSDLFTHHIQPLELFDFIKLHQNKADLSSVYQQIFGNDPSREEWDYGQIFFTRYEKEEVVGIILASIFFYSKEETIDNILKIIKRRYPIKYKSSDEEIEREVILKLKEWRSKGLLFYYNMRFSAKRNLIHNFISSLRNKKHINYLIY